MVYNSDYLNQKKKEFFFVKGKSQEMVDGFQTKNKMHEIPQSV